MPVNSSSRNVRRVNCASTAIVSPSENQLARNRCESALFLNAVSNRLIITRDYFTGLTSTLSRVMVSLTSFQSKFDAYNIKQFRVYVHVCIFLLCMCVCMFVRMLVCMLVCMPVCIYVCIRFVLMLCYLRLVYKRSLRCGSLSIPVLIFCF